MKIEEIKKGEISIVKMTSDENKVFAKKGTGEIAGKVIFLAKDDIPDNYIEVDPPAPEEKNTEQQ